MPHEKWCGGICADCTHPCPLDEEISCSPDCEALKSDGSRIESLCLASGCDAFSAEREKRNEYEKKKEKST